MTDTPKRSNARWILPALGVLLALGSVSFGDWSDSAFYGLAAGAMIVNAATDLRTQMWPRIISVGLVVAAVLVWVAD